MTGKAKKKKVKVAQDKPRHTKKGEGPSATASAAAPGVISKNAKERPVTPLTEAKPTKTPGKRATRRRGTAITHRVRDAEWPFCQHEASNL